MAITYFNQATALALGAISGKTAPATPWVLRLFSNNHTPDVADTEANYTEVTGGGYTALSLAATSWVVTPNTPSSMTFPAQVVLFTGATSAPGTVYGYYVTDANGKALFAERLTSPPFTPSVAGDNVVISLGVNNGALATSLSNKFIVQGTADAMLTGAQFLGALGTGIVKVTTTTGVLSVAVAGDFPTLNQNTSGTAANLSGTPALPNGTTATTQAASDNSTKLATTAYVDVSLDSHPLVSATLRIHDSDIRAANDMTIVAGVAGKVICPLFAFAVGDATAGLYNTAITCSVRYAGNNTSLLSTGSVFDSTHQTRLTAQTMQSGTSFVKTTFDPVAKALTVRATPASINGNAANYVDITIWYFLLTDPT